VPTEAPETFEAEEIDGASSCPPDEPPVFVLELGLVVVAVVFCPWELIEKGLSTELDIRLPYAYL